MRAESSDSIHNSSRGSKRKRASTESSKKDDAELRTKVLTKGNKKFRTALQAATEATPSGNTVDSDKLLWKTLLHNGVVFPPRYLPHRVPMQYDGKPVRLGPCAEEVASMYAKVDEKKIRDIKMFEKNIMAGLRRAMRKDQSPDVNTVIDFEKCDFSKIFKYVRHCGIRYEEDTEDTVSLRKRCRFAIVNGEQEFVSGFEIPHPRIFLGLDEKIGMVKDRVFPEDVTINIGEESPVPDCPIEGHNWGRVIHEPKEAWVAFWMDSVYGDEEYAEITGQKVRPLRHLLGTTVQRL